MLCTWRYPGSGGRGLVWGGGYKVVANLPYYITSAVLRHLFESALRPDLLVLIGDIFEGHGRLESERGMVPILRGFSAPLGVLAVTGNHESHGDVEAAARLFEDAGVHLLRGKWKEVRPGVLIAGVDDPSDLRESPRDPDRIRKALAGRPKGAATVFLSHRPEEVEKAASEGVDLMLSAHTHGGQIWPFNYVVRSVFPLIGGRYEVGGMTIIVCMIL